ncbi:hypothetical protein EV580_3147 [Mycobacterium sp. BK086]|nr:hypothetical protein EV580_3147 [Mycobacterium sp. BK086]
MKLSDDEVEMALFAVIDAISLRNRVGWRVPLWMKPLARKLDLASTLSPGGHENHAESGSLGDGILIGTREVAEILECSPRNVRRYRSDLGGELIGGRLLFRLTAVVRYVKERENDRTS